MRTFFAVAAATWGIVMALSPILQIKRMVERGSSADVSISYFLVLIVGFGLWIGYGLTKQDPVLIVPNSLATLIALATVLVAWRYRARGHGTKEVDAESP